MAQDERLLAIENWLKRDLGMRSFSIEPASADASFRRYFRVISDRESFVVMDAPPDKEDLAAYLKVARLLAQTGVNVPRVIQKQIDLGFLLLSDLGSTQYLTVLQGGGDSQDLYRDALAALLRIQVHGRELARQLPPYDRAQLLREMELLPEWFLTKHLGIDIDRKLRQLLDAVFDTLIDSALAQPASFVHRDYHSRNLMLCPTNNPGILDFQDAVRGAVTYDLVSLLKDCYISWPAARVRSWALAHRAALAGAGIETGGDPEEFMRWFDLMGLQRHIKVLGIFARLWYRDAKKGYLADLPLVLDYTREAAARYAPLQEFARFLAERVAPQFEAAQRRALA
jgi:N-acetylmuramate 1-kinase